MTTKMLSDFVNNTDEIFMVFTIENNWDVWQAQYKNRSATCNEDLIPVPPAKYTEYKGKKARKYSGWNQKGLDRWNQIWRKINRNRENEKKSLNEYEEQVNKKEVDPEETPPPVTFDGQYLEYARKTWGDEEKKPNQQDQHAERPRIMHGFNTHSEWMTLGLADSDDEGPTPGEQVAL